MLNKNLPIGVFDSGLGGLTAVRELKKILPDEDIIYFGDTGRVPYGTRSYETIKKYACDDMNFLLTNNVKAVLVACGTVSASALPLLKSTFEIPVIGVVEPASALACKKSKSGRIAVLATPSTVGSEAFNHAISAMCPDAEVLGIGCPMFVPLVENGYTDTDNPVTTLIAKEYVSKLKDFKPDVIILGCTHYPIIKDTVKKCANEIIGDVEIVDSGSAAASAMKEYLASADLENTCGGNAKYFVSDRPSDFGRLASVFLKEQVEDVTKIDIEKYFYKN